MGGDISAFKLYRRERDTEPKEIATIPSAETSYLDKTAVKDNTYWYSLSSVNADKQESPTSKEARISY